MSISSVTIESWSDIHSYARTGWLFRGQRLADWPLQTSFERFWNRNRIAADDRRRMETELLRDFRRGLHQYAVHVPESESTIEWLSLMQHHGAPTRLLDFTYSLYIACYFALEAADSRDGAESAVWAINGRWALHESIKLFEDAGDTRAKELKLLLDEKAESVYHNLFFQDNMVRAAVPINAFRLNERLRIQKGIFLVPGDLQSSFMENLQALPESNSTTNIVRIHLPSSMRLEALENLYYMNISRTSLFPGLDGYAQSLGVFHPAFGAKKWYAD